MMYKNNFVVVIKCDGKILREQNNSEVYLPFGSKYSILLKNKDARRALVDIEVDGKNVMKGHKLIVNGNETQEIKGFMRDMKKTNRFKFIHKTKEIQNYRGDRIDDGLVRVSYQFEEPKQTPIWLSDTTAKWNYTYTINDSYTTKYSSPAVYNCNNSTTMSISPRQDEGITVKGEKISQKYNYGNIGDLESVIYTIVLQLKGQTVSNKKIKKAITVKTKFKCETCGKKNRSINKFCSNCGTYLN